MVLAGVAAVGESAVTREKITSFLLLKRLIKERVLRTAASV